jgi:hypothetical protein
VTGERRRQRGRSNADLPVKSERRKYSRGNNSKHVAVETLCVSLFHSSALDTMGFTAALMGGSFGFAVQVFSNAIQKIPLSRGTCARDGSWKQQSLC